MTRMQRLAKLLADIEAMINKEVMSMAKTAPGAPEDTPIEVIPDPVTPPPVVKPAPGSPDDSTGVPEPTPSPDEAQSGANPKGGVVPPAPPAEQPPKAGGE